MTQDDSNKGADKTKKTTGAETVRWDLTDLYSGVDDPQLDTDLEKLLAMAKNFEEAHQGKLMSTLGASLALDAKMTCLAGKLMIYLFLKRSTDATNEQIQQRMGQVHEAWSRAAANHMTFFEHELVGISDEDFEAILAKDENAKRHRPMLELIRANRKYLLDEPVERALTLRAPYGAGEWSDYLDEMESELRFHFDDKEMTLPEILNVVSNDSDGDRRAKALEVFSHGLTGQCTHWRQGDRGRGARLCHAHQLTQYWQSNRRQHGGSSARRCRRGGCQARATLLPIARGTSGPQDLALVGSKRAAAIRR